MKKTITVLHGQAGATHKKEQPMYMYIAVYALLALAAFVMPRAMVYGGLAPFGVSIAACASGGASFLVYIGAVAGYLMNGQIVMPLRYIAAVSAVAGVRWAMGNSKSVTEHAAFVPLLASGGTLVTGLALNMMNGFQIDVLLGELCESILAGGAAYFFNSTVRVLKANRGPRQLQLMEQSSLVITLAVLLMATNAVTVSDVSVGRVLTMTAILLAAKAGQQQGGMLAGIVLGAATALASPSHAFVAAAYAFGGMLSGLFSRFGKAACAMVFVLTNTLVLLNTGDSQLVIIGIYEVIAASLLFFILPRRMLMAANAVFCRVQDVPAVEGLRRSVDMRLTYAAQTMNEIAKTVDSVSEKLTTMNAPSMKEIYADVCRELCNGCRRRDTCWNDHFADSMSAFRHMGQTLRENGSLTLQDVDTVFRNDCHHCGELVRSMNTGYTQFVMKEHAYRRLSDIRGIVTDQFEGMSALLMDLSEDFKKMDQTDEQASVRIEHICRRYRLPLTEALCVIGKRNRLRVEMLVEGETAPPSEARIYQEIADACGCEFGEPEVSRNGYFTRICLSERTKYTVRLGSAQLNCRTEHLCGDAFEQFYDRDGRYCVVLSDGMGTGGRAAVDGAMTAALAGRMLQAGFHFDSILRIINSSLIVKSTEESLSTLDAVRIDLFTGTVQGLKAGAAPSFLYSNGHVSKISASSLPIGILRDITSEEYEEHLSKGDVLVLVSDGVAEGDCEWLEELIARLAVEQTDENVMANEIVFHARERQDSACGDDTTALVIRVA